MSRIERFALQSAAVAALDHVTDAQGKRLGQLGARMAKCCRTPIASSVIVNYSAKREAASYRNLATCGSVWACPVCAAKVTERRRAELEQAITTWEAAGGYVALLTLTFPHRADDDLGELLARLSHATRRLWGGKLAKRDGDRWHVSGQVRALEVTHGANGWHPHMHTLLFFAPGQRPDLADLRPRLVSRWRAACSAARLLDVDDQAQLVAFERIAVDLRSGLRAGAYVTKMGLDQEELRRHGLACEVTKAPAKKARSAKGRAPFGILRDFLDDGDLADAQLFATYAAQFKGQVHLRWSKGLRAQLQLADERTDEELAAEARGEDEVALVLLPLSTWRRVVRGNLRGELLAVAGRGDPQAVWDFLGELDPAIREELDHDEPEEAQEQETDPARAAGQGGGSDEGPVHPGPRGGLLAVGVPGYPPGVGPGASGCVRAPVPRIAGLNL
jgi:hypothetical protein